MLANKFWLHFWTLANLCLLALIGFDVQQGIVSVEINAPYHNLVAISPDWFKIATYIICGLAFVVYILLLMHQGHTAWLLPKGVLLAGLLITTILLITLFAMVDYGRWLEANTDTSIQLDLFRIIWYSATALSVLVQYPVVIWQLLK